MSEPNQIFEKIENAFKEELRIQSQLFFERNECYIDSDQKINFNNNPFLEKVTCYVKTNYPSFGFFFEISNNGCNIVFYSFKEKVLYPTFPDAHTLQILNITPVNFEKKNLRIVSFSDHFKYGKI